VNPFPVAVGVTVILGFEGVLLFFIFVKVAIKVKNLIFVIECTQQYTY
jgi:hypothetical protein